MRFQAELHQKKVESVPEEIKKIRKVKKEQPESNKNCGKPQLRLEDVSLLSVVILKIMLLKPFPFRDVPILQLSVEEIGMYYEAKKAEANAATLGKTAVEMDAESIKIAEAKTLGEKVAAKRKREQERKKNGLTAGGVGEDDSTNEEDEESFPKAGKPKAGISSQMSRSKAVSVSASLPKKKSVVASSSSPSSSADISFSEASSEDEDDETEKWGEMTQIVSFHSKKKTFLLQWEDTMIRSHRATDVLKDWTIQAIKHLYEHHFWEPEVEKWIDRRCQDSSSD
jgi:hypothetical protein